MRKAHTAHPPNTDDKRSAAGGPIAASAAAVAGCCAGSSDATAVEGSSRGVTRDERSANATAHIDWFACSFQPGSGFRDVIASIFNVPRMLWKMRKGGWQGYDTCFDLGPFGLLAFGGEHQRGTAHLSLNAHGCAGIQDWDAVKVWCEASGARITRIDLAHDDLIGGYINIEQARSWLAEGQFSTGGRTPCARLIDDLGSDKGKTLYVGQRQNGKLCRVYEKGKQLGDPASTWCRAEVELRGKGRRIPHDILTRPSDYFAGAYPCFANLSTRQDKVRTLAKASAITYDRLVKCLRSQYGQTLHVMMHVERGDIFEVFKQVERPGTPKRLENLPLPRGESSQDDEA